MCEHLQAQTTEVQYLCATDYKYYLLVYKRFR